MTLAFAVLSSNTECLHHMESSFFVAMERPNNTQQAELHKETHTPFEQEAPCSAIIMISPPIHTVPLVLKDHSLR